MRHLALLASLLFALATPAHAAPPIVNSATAVCDPDSSPLTCSVPCNLHAKYDASDTGRKTLVTGPTGKKIYVCAFILANGGTATNLALYEGSDADCATNSAALTPVYQIIANQSIGVMAPYWTGLKTSTAAYYLCISASAANAHQAEVWYAIR